MNKLIGLSFVLVCLSACQKSQNLETIPYTYLSGRTFTDKKVNYEVIDGEAIVEGDISLGTQEQAEAIRNFKEKSRNAVSVSARSSLWEKGIVYYEVDPALPNPDRVFEAQAMIQEVSRIRFVKRTSQRDYVYYQAVAGTVCSSGVGRRGGRQVIKLSERCSVGSTAHESLHALGLWHEQSRSDRDDFIVIHWDNIESEKKFNFDFIGENERLLNDYDYSSIMHYGSMAFSKNEKPTITKKDGSSTKGMGQRKGLSDGDVKAINSLYSRDEGELAIRN